MDIKKLLLGFATLALLVSAVPQKSVAQWSLGASYEIRDEEPKNGFGVRLERDILQKLPIVNLGLRAHFSYFNDENQLTRDSQSISTEITSYDYGLAAVGGVSVGLVAPYVGLGLGSETADLDYQEESLPGESDSNLYWNGFVGAEISPIPAIKPFVEYRVKSNKEFKDLSTDDFDTSTGRFIVGVSLSF
ncbi:outer membrane beta-barrel protein [Fodinibius salsisoli]|uniref:Outer membrane beta-barrel protein n=1 Tax=Fodinibius salsisoli TaxID=2820877 RepID=A0ABT3PQ65_9BACT|nr:outer membrane beta-barrel protein [Fodinibius salsisoli]MCW9707998.1 outer membrane beta-barrel protein [Fodinibius salsisoli]